MPQGVKKIKFVPQPAEANNSNSRFGSDKWVVVPADKKAYFDVKEWHKDTKDAQKKGSLYWMVMDKDRKEVIAASISITGGLSLETNVKFNFLTKSYSFIKQAGNFYDELNGIVAFGQYVKVEGKIEVRLYKDFFIFGYKTGSFKGELKLELKSSFGIVQQYGKDNVGFFVENYLYFSGLTAKVKIKALSKVLGYKVIDYDNSPGEEEKPYTILDPAKVKIFKVYLLKA